MATLKELRDERLRKLAELKKAGINPYPAKVTRSKTISDVIDNFDSLIGANETITGRITNIRKFGKIAFIVIKDQSGSIQLFLAENNGAVSDKDNSIITYSNLNLLDSGDFIEATGKVAKSKTDERTIEVSKLRLITKSLRPLPAKQDGFSNKEERLRRRYIDININEDVKERIIRRSKFWQSTRDYLNKNNFIEVNVPVLEHTTGGADANPFITHMDALNQDYYLRISHELPLKKLLGGGFEKVYDIGPRFRNENYSDEHLPEHIAMEWYWAYANWQEGMKFMEQMYLDIAKSTFNKTSFKLNNLEVNFETKWIQIDYGEEIKKRFDVDIFNTNIDQIKQLLVEHKLEVEKTNNLARGVDKLWQFIRKDITGPAWLINTPLYLSPLSKVNENNPLTVQRFQAIIGGTELGNGFSELNDPLEQLSRFKDQQNLRDKGDKEAMMLDIDYIEMLEYGMPPACGFGYSERVFWVLEGVSAREGVPFPQLRLDIDSTTKKIYNDIILTHDKHN